MAKRLTHSEHKSLKACVPRGHSHVAVAFALTVPVTFPHSPHEISESVIHKHSDFRDCRLPRKMM